MGVLRRFFPSKELLDPVHGILGNCQSLLGIFPGGLSMREKASIRWVTESVHTIHKIKVRKGNGYMDTGCFKVTTELEKVVDLFRLCAFFKENGFKSLFDSLLRMETGLAVYCKLEGFPGENEVFVSGG